MVEVRRLSKSLSIQQLRANFEPDTAELKSSPPPPPPRPSRQTLSQKDPLDAPPLPNRPAQTEPSFGCSPTVSSFNSSSYLLDQQSAWQRSPNCPDRKAVESAMTDAKLIVGDGEWCVLIGSLKIQLLCAHTAQVISWMWINAQAAQAAGQQAIDLRISAALLSMAELDVQLWVGTAEGHLMMIRTNRLGGPMQVQERRLHAHSRPIQAIFEHNGEIVSVDEGGGVWGFETPITGTLLSCLSGRLWCALGKGQARGISLENSSIMQLDPPDSNVGPCLGITETSAGNWWTVHEAGRLLGWTGKGQLRVNISLGPYRLITACWIDCSCWIVLSTGKAWCIEVNDEQGIARLNAEWTASPNITKLVPICNQVILAHERDRIQWWDAEGQERTRILARKRLQQSNEPLNVQIVSWNVDSQRPPDSLAEETWWRAWLRSNDPSTDIIVVGLQEIVDLESKKRGAKALLREGEEDSMAGRLWSLQIKNILDDDDWTIIHQQTMVGLFLLVALRKRLVPRVRLLAGCQGGLLCRMLIGGQSLCFVNCHLAAGNTSIAERNCDLAAILRTPTFPACSPSHETELWWRSGGNGQCVSHHDHVFVLGDLNYRLSMERKEAISLLSNLTDLSAADQLNQQRAIPSHPLHPYVEAPLSFPPTYKYDRGNDRWDSSAKARCPSWCDRILYWPPNEATQKPSMSEYKTYPQMMISDHRPISLFLSLQ